jgi:hypothetical protein
MDHAVTVGTEDRKILGNLIPYRNAFLEFSQGSQVVSLDVSSSELAIPACELKTRILDRWCRDAPWLRGLPWGGGRCGDASDTDEPPVVTCQPLDHRSGHVFRWRLRMTVRDRHETSAPDRPCLVARGRREAVPHSAARQRVAPTECVPCFVPERKGPVRAELQAVNV